MPSKEKVGLLTRCQRYLAQAQLFEPGEPGLLAVSGGVDSVVLADLFARLGLRWAVAHAHFGLRGAGADGDADFVRALAERYQVPYHERRLATRAYAKRQGGSIQMAARTLRYQWFQALCKRYGYARVATAHHLNDSLETSLRHLAKGSGIQGLCGIPSTYQAHVIRPLLWASRQEIEAYAIEQGLAWREDPSNASCHYERNRIRHQVIPLLKAMNPSLERTFLRTQARLSQSAQLLQAEADRLAQQAYTVTPSCHGIELAPLEGLPWAPIVLTAWLSPHGFSFAQIAQWWAAQPSPGKYIMSKTHCLQADRGKWLLSARRPAPAPGQCPAYLLPLGGEQAIPSGVLAVTSCPASGYQLSPQPQVAALDRERLVFPLLLRRWQAGDAFYPLGMAHRKKVSDFLIDEKVPRYAKAEQWVITSQGQLVWLVGRRIDNRFKVTSATRQLAVLSFCAHGPQGSPTA